MKQVISIIGIVLTVGILALNAAIAETPASNRAPKSKKVDTVLGTDLAIMAEHMIEIKAYDPATRSYEVVAVQFPGEGESYVTLEGLIRAIDTVHNLKSRIQRDPTAIVGQQFKTDRDLPSLTAEELNLRRNK